MKIIVRILIVLLLILVVAFQVNLEFYDLIIFSLLIVGLIINYLPTKDNKYVSDYVTNYVFWMSMVFSIFSLRELNLFVFKDLFLILVLLKSIVLVINYVKFRNVFVPSSILSKVWIFTLFLYLSEIILNSTHGTKNICFLLGVMSCIESISIIIRLKEWKPKVLSVFSVKK